jgi:hypothetical protein
MLLLEARQLRPKLALFILVHAVELTCGR